MTPETLLAQLLGPLGALVACAVVIVAFQREWIVPGAAYRREIRRGEFFQRLALSGTSLAQKGIELATANKREEPPM